MTPARDAEWLETDGRGGFASGTVSGARSRRYHAILNLPLTPPTGRTVFVTGFDARIVRSDGGEPEWISSQRYAPDAASDGASVLEEFRIDPWPTWTWRLRDRVRVRQELFLSRQSGRTVLRWKLLDRAPGARLEIRPFLAPRDLHALHHENPAFRFDAQASAGTVTWQPYPVLPPICARHNGSYRHEPVWYRQFQLDEERARGFDFVEDAGAPGVLSWELSAGDAVCILSTSAESEDAEAAPATAARLARAEQLRRGRLGGRLSRAADAYLVARGTGKTIIAGYPWFTDWGRDTFISLEGLCFETGRLEDARSILAGWAGLVSEGMLPNRFIDQGDEPEFNSVDASLWYVVAVHRFLRLIEGRKKRIPARERSALLGAVQAILEGYSAGTRYGIHADQDGLLAAGVPGVQLTWMDARVGDWVVTPRIGKPVEIQALWINALLASSALDARWRRAGETAFDTFRARFWNPAAGCLFDVVDADGRPGQCDGAVRPNQILAVGGLPLPLLEGERADRVVSAVETRLLAPIGLRSLAPGSPGYAPHYRGGPVERDGAYHMGTVWPWLLAPFVEAWLRVRGDTAANRRAARTRFYRPLEAHLDQAGLGHVSEVTDGDPPFTPGGCPFQAWSVAAAIRIERMTRPESGGGR